MNWEALGSIAEATGAAGVIVSLIYLAAQIRDQNRESRSATTNALTQQWSLVMSGVSTSESLGAIYIRGLNSFDELAPAEKIRFTTFLSQMTQIAESLQIHFLEGKLDPDLWRGYDARMKDVFSQPGAKSWWATRRHHFSEKAQLYIEAIVTEASGRRGYEQFNDDP